MSTRLREIPPRFRTGFPTPEDTRTARDDATYQRAMTAYRFWYPSVSLEGILRGQREAGIADNRDIATFACGPRHVMFTGNSDTPYGGANIDLRHGPVVVELPPGPYLVLAMDHHQRWIMDMGLPGPDEGKGGRHLLVPPNYRGRRPPGHFVGESASCLISIGIRAVPQQGDLDAALRALRAVRIYPLSTAANPALYQFVDLSTKPVDITSLRWEDNLGFWQLLHSVIDYEPVVDEFRPMYGLLAALGLEKGRPFAPDARMAAILDRAAKDARDQMLVAAFDSARADRTVWPDRRWEWAALASEGSDFETANALDMQARDRWFIQAIGMSPKMLLRNEGAGSLYWLGHRDATGEYLDGGATYRLNVPLPVPAKLFWSVTVYDAPTRSQIRTAQDRAALRSMFELRDAAGSSVDLFFGPRAPAGHENHWIQTTPGKGWFVYFRVYGPDRPAFDNTWQPGDFERVA